MRNWNTIERRAIPLILAIAVALVFAQTVRFAFLTYDDSLNIYANPYLNSGDPPSVTPPDVVRFWAHGYYELYTPVTYTIWAAGARFARCAPYGLPGGTTATLNPAVFHGVGVLFHIMNTLLVYALLCRLFLSHANRRIFCGIGAGVYGLHPLQAEAVAWVTGNNTLFCAFFVWIALLGFLRGARSLPGETPRPALWFALATAAYVLALLCKPTAVVLPLLATILMLSPRPAGAAGARKSVYVGLLFWCALAGACAVVTRLCAETPVVATPLWTRPFLAANALAFYAAKLFFPVGLCSEYDLGQDTVLSSWTGYAAAGVPLLMGYILWRVPGETGKHLWVATGLTVAGVLPMLGLVPYYYHAVSLVADRYVYLAMFGAAYGVTAVLIQLPKPRRGTAAGGVLLAILAILAARQTGTWRDTETFAAHTVAVNPRSWRRYGDWGNALMARGDMGNAVAAYRAAYRIKPEMPTVALNLGIGLLRGGNYPEAEAVLRRLLRTQPQSATVRCNLSAALSAQGRHADAVRVARDAVRLRPDWSLPYHYLGSALRQSGDAVEAARVLRQAADLSAETR